MFNCAKGKKWLVMNALLVGVLVSLLGIQVVDRSDTIDRSVRIGIGNEKVITLGHVAYAAGSVDYTYDGTNDDVQFQAALNALPATGGRLVDVSAVQKNFGATVTRAISNVTIEGSGAGSYFVNDGITALFTAGGNGWSFNALRTDAGGIAMGATTAWVWNDVTIDTTYYATMVDEATTGSAFSIPVGLLFGSTAYVISNDANAFVKAAGNVANIFLGDLVGVADGTDDDVEIQAAIDALASGGEIVLTEGAFTLGDALLVDNADIKIRGQGNSTVVTLANAANSLLTGNANVGQPDIAVTSSVGFATGDTIILRDDNGFGTYKISGIAGNTLTASRNLGRNYTVAANGIVYLIYPVLNIEANNIELSHFKVEGNRANRMNGLAGDPVFGARASDIVYTDVDVYHGEADGVIQIGASIAVDNIKVHDIWMDNTPSHGIFPYMVVAGAGLGVGRTEFYNLYFTDIGDKAIVTLNLSGVGYYRKFIANQVVIDGTGKAPLFTVEGTQSSWGDGIQNHSNGPDEIYISDIIASDIGRNGIYSLTEASPTEGELVNISRVRVWDWNTLGFAAAYAVAGIQTDGRDNVAISHFYTDAANRAQAAANGVLVMNGSRVLIEDGRVRRIANSAHYAVRANNVSFLSVDKVSSDGNRIAAYVGLDDTKITNSDAREIYIGIGGSTADRYTIIGNTVTYRLYMDIGAGNMDDVKIIGNTLGSTGIIFAGAGSITSGEIIRNNIGYVTENSGTATIASGNTVATITHGLSVTPSEEKISLVALEIPTAAPIQLSIADNATATQFWVVASGDPGVSGQDFGWSYSH